MGWVGAALQLPQAGSAMLAADNCPGGSRQSNVLSARKKTDPIPVMRDLAVVSDSM